MPSLLVSTNGGIEDIVCQEVMAALPHKATTNNLTAEVPPAALHHPVQCTPCPFGIVGYAGIDVHPEDEAIVLAILMHLRSAFDILRFHGTFEWPSVPVPEGETPDKFCPTLQLGLEPLCEYIKHHVDVPALAQPGVTFRVTSIRQGRHSFNSCDVERATGAVFGEKYGVRGSMKEFDVHVRVDVAATKALVGTQLNKVELARRYTLPYVSQSSIRSNMAFAMLQLAKVQAGQTILDPFCGNGMILVEAASIFGDTVHLKAADGHKRIVEGTRLNLTGRSNNVIVEEYEATEVSHHNAPQSIDAIITNIWVAKKKGVVDVFYRRLLFQAKAVVKVGGRFVCSVLYGQSMLGEIYRQQIWSIEDLRIVKAGEMLMTVFTLQRGTGDPVWESLTQSRMELAKYIPRNPMAVTEEEQGSVVGA